MGSSSEPKLNLCEYRALLAGHLCLCVVRSQRDNLHMITCTSNTGASGVSNNSQLYRDGWIRIERGTFLWLCQSKSFSAWPRNHHSSLHSHVALTALHSCVYHSELERISGKPRECKRRRRHSHFVDVVVECCCSVLAFLVVLSGMHSIIGARGN